MVLTLHRQEGLAGLLTQAAPVFAVAESVAEVAAPILIQLLTVAQVAWYKYNLEPGTTVGMHAHPLIG